MRYERTRPIRLLAAVLAAGLVAQGCLGRGTYMRPSVAVCSDCAAAPEQLDYRVVLIGDTGEDYGDTDVLRALTRVAQVDPERTMVLFLGDNVYPLGIPPREEDDEEPDPEREVAERILAVQVEAVERAGAEGVFIPGNHDWARKRPTGMARVLAQAEYIAEIADDPERVRVLPRDACPGPMVLDRGDTLRILVSDTVWLFEADDPRGEECEFGLERSPQRATFSSNLDYYDRLEQMVAGAGGRRVLFATHHPLKTRGPHGGHVTVVDVLFPFTYLRSWLYAPLPFLYPIVRYSLVKSDEDLVGERNQVMVERVETALRRAGSQTITAGGHEHSLQVFDDPFLDITYLVSGAGSKATPVGKASDTLFKRHGRGFMAVDYFRDGRVSLRVIVPDGPDAHEVPFATWIE